MLEKSFEQLYFVFRANYYKRMVKKIGARDGSLTATESYCVEIIFLLRRPTVSRFAKFLNISVPNANYKVGRLVDKGYIVKVPSEEDKREFHLAVTPKFLDYYGLKDGSIRQLMRSIRKDFSKEEIELMDDMMRRMVKLMEEAAHD